MAFRLGLMIAALSLVVAGCNQHARTGRTVHGSYPYAYPQSHQYPYQPPVQAQRIPPPVYLRGPVHGVDPKVAAHRAAAQPAYHQGRRLRNQNRYPLQRVNAAPAAPAPYKLDSGDRLRIVVFGQENLSRSYSVDGGGFISMPLIGGVKARGATTFQLERRISSKLKTKYVKDPKVTVEIQDYRPFFILGEVRRPGQFPYVNGMTVRTAVAIAGGYTDRANENKVKLTRRVNGSESTFKVPDNYAVRPGDTIYVNERFF